MRGTTGETLRPLRVSPPLFLSFSLSLFLSFSLSLFFAFSPFPAQFESAWQQFLPTAAP